MALGMASRTHTKRWLLAGLVGLALLGVGITAGYFIGRSMEQHAVAAAGRDAVDSILRGGGLPNRGSAALLSNSRELPAPGSAEAAQLLASGSIPGFFLQQYLASEDADLISEEETATFLTRLKQALQANTEGPDGQDDDDDDSMEIAPFVRVARDILNYLRFNRSGALLALLRQFARSGTITVADVSPDELQTEVARLLNITTLDNWYMHSSSRAGPELRTLPPPVPTPGDGSTSQASRAQLLVSSSDSASSGRRRSLTAAAQSAGTRRLLAAASIPAITQQTASQLPTDSPPMTLREMLCAAKPYSPTGLQGITLPPSSKPSAARVGSDGCPEKATGIFNYMGVAFTPVVIPVAFHIQRFSKDNVFMPAVWDPVAAAQNIIDFVNRMYSGTGFQFKVHEVRSDPTKYSYLLLATQNDWQTCTGLPSQEQIGFPCLTETATYPDVAALAEKHIVNVIIGGSQDPAFCDTTKPDAPCSQLYLGYSRAMGPWFAVPSKTWAEGVAAENWITMSWDMFNPATNNAARFWDGGGVTLAHELGHYLGLMHTHEGAAPCDGNGLARSDAVPDTPQNQRVDSWAAGKGQLATLAGWCSDFRKGKAPQAAELATFNSCNVPGTVDNVLNVMSYLPDACCMVFTPNQVARLQWATASFRPKMLAAFRV